MERQLSQLGRELVVFTCGVAGLVFLIGLLRGYGLLQMLKISTSLAVAAVPEGLPAIATTTMAYGVWRLRKENVLVRRLDSLETLGAIQILCFDKTGTLTMNRMSVMGGLVGTTPFSVSPTGKNAGNGDFSNLLRTLVLCNEAALETENGIAVARGSATETALLEFADRLGVDFDELRSEFPLIQLQQRTIKEFYPLKCAEKIRKERSAIAALFYTMGLRDTQEEVANMDLHTVYLLNRRFNMVPGGGVEPPRYQVPADFEFPEGF